MEQWIPTEIIGFFRLETLITAVRILVVLIASFLGLKLLAFVVGQVVKRRFSQQSVMITRKVITYTGVVIIVMVVLAQLGLSLGAVLGAAGIVGIAVGFAAQTSVSNIISGLFLISEKSFAVGDVIRAAGHLGIVMTIDLLSVKIRTFDNQYIRLPNETLIKSEVTNITRFPIRRLDVEFTVSYGTDLQALRDVLLDIARRHPGCLDEPEPLYLVRRFAPMGIEIQFGVWFPRADYLAVKNAVMSEVHTRLTEAGVRFAVPPAVALPSDAP